MKKKQLTEDQLKRLEELEKHEKVKAEGYAGVLPTGQIVDRRNFPEAIPMQENSFLNIPKPKEL